MQYVKLILVEFSGIFWSVEFPPLDLYFKIMTNLGDICFNFFSRSIVNAYSQKKKKSLFSVNEVFQWDPAEYLMPGEALTPNLNQLELVASVH